jgi:rod shape-determining protein MreD
MSRIAGSRRDVAMLGLRRQTVPVLSTLAASLLHALPIVVTTPLVPDIAFLVLLSWRLLRPEMWQAHVALPLGLFDDLMAGHPIGQSMALWTLAFLAYDFVDSRVGWRDYWTDWLFASVGIGLYTLGTFGVAHLMAARMPILVVVPQLLLSIMAYPIVSLIVVALDRWRLAR